MRIGMKAVTMDQENTLTNFVFIFQFGNENDTGKLGQENEISYAGYRENFKVTNEGCL